MKTTLDDIIVQAKVIRSGIKPKPNSRFNCCILSDNLQYEAWKNLTIRFLASNYPNDRCNQDFEIEIRNFEVYGYKQSFMDAIIAILMACKEIPTLPSFPNSETMNDKQINININQSQNQIQTQEQKLVLDVFLEAMKDELTGKQVKELKDIVKQEPNPANARTKVVEKIKSWGGDVLTNVIANIITNPTIWCGLLG